MTLGGMHAARRAGLTSTCPRICSPVTPSPVGSFMTARGAPLLHPCSPVSVCSPTSSSSSSSSSSRRAVPCQASADDSSPADDAPSSSAAPAAPRRRRTIKLSSDAPPAPRRRRSTPAAAEEPQEAPSSASSSARQGTSAADSEAEAAAAVALRGDYDDDYLSGLMEEGDVAPAAAVKPPKAAAKPRSKKAAATSAADAEAGEAIRQAKQQLRQALPSTPKAPAAQKATPAQLREDDPMFLPALTDDDLAQDPPGHRSGYVAVIGRPNAGKSTLINQIVGQKLSIVSFKPQTTRHRIMGISSDTDYQMILFDTPGIIERKRTKLEERMMAAVVSSIQDAEAIVAVVDAADRPKEALAMFQPGSDWSGPPMAVLLNKSDLLSPSELQELEEWYIRECKAKVVLLGSALEGSGVEELKKWAVSQLPEGPTLYPKGIISEMPERFFVSEIIREKIFHQYDQEIPYAVQVEVIEFTERPGAKDFISVLILVEKESQVSILVGKGGEAIRKLGRAARADIEKFIDRPVYLVMQCKLAKLWREDKDQLTKMGYYDAK